MEDNDMAFRAERSGLNLVWVHEQTSMLHQWHPSERNRKPLLKLRNDLRFQLTRHRIEKNRNAWGGRP